ncbi:(Lyso)-N-acylphosphatidylethanolamine lipase-like [Sitophilus oryzae]|uniref:(Lyso)-N-acylphosphatidylethanolamine lipase-like n=1 Tax=Sitophilus oryzae TaxID=7048 RepID=A0A6J2Y9I3_SITOR|nr:(Lyso)-N-acylphosphatidylethanolamine lipase-like [Sitophilus oryzae]
MKMSENCNKRGWWTKYSEDRLIEVESKILTVLKSAYKTWFVSIGSTIGKDDQIWTIALNDQAQNTPLVMLHGFAAGLGFWCLNLDDIAKDRPVYAIDLIGFGRSSRPSFAKDCDTAEQQWISALEAWRKQLELDKFILLGHSFGGYLATSYAMSYPDRVKHLILADPWGFSEKPANIQPRTWVKVLGVVLYPLTYFNPLATVRAVGPFGPWLVRKLRSDISNRYEDAFEDKHIITEYIYHCNSQYPSGESAFHTFLKGFGYAKNPMITRYDKLHDHIPITVVYGEKSWITKDPGYVLKDKKKYVNIEIIPRAGHHLYSDEPKIFNEIVRKTCKLSEDPDTIVQNFGDSNSSTRILKHIVVSHDTLTSETVHFEDEEIIEFSEDSNTHITPQ